MRYPLLLGVFAVAVSASPCAAAIITFTNQSDYNAATGASLLFLDFNAEPDGPGSGDFGDVDFNSHLAGGLVIDSLVGPVALGVSAGLDGGWRTFISIGRLFR